MSHGFRDRDRLDQVWQVEAACAGMDTDLFYGNESETRDEKDRRERKAKAVCRGCPVRAQCLETVMHDEYRVGERGRSGIWAGITPAERATLAAKLRRQAARRRQAS